MLVRAFLLSMYIACVASGTSVILLYPTFAEGNPPAPSTSIDMTVALKNEHDKAAIDGDSSDPVSGKMCGVLVKKKVDGTVYINGIEQPGVAEERISTDGCPILTLGHAIEHVLYANFKEDAALDPKMKAARARLAEHIADNPAAKLTAPQIALIETLLGRVYGGLILSQTYALLDPNAELPEVK
jgi:hypothetical protein